jgi:protein-S-isoprenylcysteine O-methyltransferase Ste14
MALQEEFEKQGNFLFKYRGILPLIFLLGGLIYFVADIYTSTNETPKVSFEIIQIIAIATGLLGLFIRSFTVGYTPKNTSGRNTEQQVADEVNNLGIYSIVRHPLYLGNFFMWLAIAILTANVWFIIVFTLIYWVYYERIMFAEEQFLRKKFGEIYINWANSTPAFIPCFKKYKKPTLKFSWKKVFKKEKNGLFALFLLILVFNTIKFYLETGKYITTDKWLIYTTIVSGVLYFILKILKRRTQIFNEEGR